METMQALVMSVVDAVGNDPKPDWKDSLIDACDAVEAEFDEMKEALKKQKACTESTETMFEAFDEQTGETWALCWHLVKEKGGDG